MLYSTPAVVIAAHRLSLPRASKNIRGPTPLVVAGCISSRGFGATAQLGPGYEVDWGIRAEREDLSVNAARCSRKSWGQRVSTSSWASTSLEHLKGQSPADFESAGAAWKHVRGSPCQFHLGLDEAPTSTTSVHESTQPGEQGSILRLQGRPEHLATGHSHFVAEYDDLDR